jgi:hypothetical protein
MNTTTRPLHLGRQPTRWLWLIVAAGAGASAAAAVATGRVGIWPVVLFGLAPDVSFLAGAGQPAAKGQLPTRAVPIYNLVHQPLLPIGLLVPAAVGLHSWFWFAASLAWLTHIAVDHVSGYGLRTKDGWQRA